MSVCYGNDKFVAVDSSNYFAYSTDGMNWTEGTISSSTGRKWSSVCYGNGKFVTIDSSSISSYFAYSTDGITWTEGMISDIILGGISNDGINWTESTISSTSRKWVSVCYGNGKYIAVAYQSNYFAYIYTS